MSTDTRTRRRFPRHEPFRIVKQAGTSQLNNTEWLDRQSADDAEDIRLAAYRTAQQFGLDFGVFLEDLTELIRAHLEGEPP